MRVLLAEDEEDLNFIITQKLRSEGYSVDSCYDGEEALDALAVVAILRIGAKERRAIKYPPKIANIRKIGININEKFMIDAKCVSPC